VRRLVLLGALAAAVASCGSSGRDVKPVVENGPIGEGADQVWFYAAKDKPRSLVVFLHGYGGPREETPVNHVPWLKHLASEGSDVVYPRYEVGGGFDPYPHIDHAVDAALAELGRSKVPMVVIGFSRGGRVAVDYAAFEAARGHEPKLVLAVFPGLHSPLERLGPLQKLDARTRIVMMMGDRDKSVDGIGARAILYRLEQARFPPERIQLIFVTSTKRFSATHLAPLETTPGAKKAFWTPTDRLIESAR
jgi:pimeloyl-ACP methyl ester carboxylesterase